MEALFFLIPISLLLAGGGLCCCVWAIRNGQFDDLKAPAHLLVFEDKVNKVQRSERHAGDKDGTK